MKLKIVNKTRAYIFAFTMYCLMLMVMWTTPIGEKVADFLFEGSTIYCKNEGINNSWWMERGE